MSEQRERTASLIRPIRAEDNHAMAAIIRAVMPEFGADKPGFAYFDPEVDAMAEAYARPGACYFVVELDGRLLGGAGIAPFECELERTCELQKMYFLPEARGRGLGATMGQRCLEAARAHGYRRCYLETLTGMDAAEKLYRKLGFQRLSEPLGSSGHFSCDRWYLLEFNRAE